MNHSNRNPWCRFITLNGVEHQGMIVGSRHTDGAIQQPVRTSRRIAGNYGNAAK